MDIDIEQCRENDKIKKIISNSGLPIKHIKLLLRLSDAIYINAINYNVMVEDNRFILLLISSKPDNKTGIFNTISLTNVLFRLKEIERNNDDLSTVCELKDNMLKVTIDLKT
ncbi:hypothetical protein FGU46_06840 [Methanobacterium sp. CWC-01]|uniref:hypothetical protein n=1 Tax=Methanobacterium aridiramus TaxID=2584467 RepID=UPI002575A238|nr:hypothetical protein [Methanobacterium sp. CWC-01]WJI09829.1 hypothetical protein FGU46_06840 [Methanobacterium sp. CWC-01]